MEPLPEELSDNPVQARKLRLPRVPKKEPPPPEPHRPFLIRMLRSPLHLTLGVLGLSPLVVIAEATGSDHAAVIKLVFLILVIGLIFYYIGFALFTVGSEWFKTQKRLSEMLATVFFGAGVMTVLMSHTDRKDDVFVAFVLAFGWAVIGSTWAWDRMRILGEDAQGPRLWMLIKGWMAVPGVIGGVFFIYATVILALMLLSHQGMNSEALRVWLIWYGASLCVAMGAWPAVSVELALRKKK